MRMHPVDIADGWPIVAPEDAGIDGATLGAVVGWLDDLRGSNIHAIVVARGGALVFEHYRRGADDRWGTPLPDQVHGPDTKHDLRSATKSVTGLLIGLALERGLIAGL